MTGSVLTGKVCALSDYIKSQADWVREIRLITFAEAGKQGSKVALPCKIHDAK